MSPIIGSDVDKTHVDEVEKRDLSTGSIDVDDHHMTRKILWKLDTRLVFLLLLLATERHHDDHVLSPFILDNSVS